MVSSKESWARRRGSDTTGSENHKGIRIRARSRRRRPRMRDRGLGFGRWRRWRWNLPWIRTFVRGREQ